MDMRLMSNLEEVDVIMVCHIWILSLRDTFQIKTILQIGFQGEEFG